MLNSITLQSIFQDLNEETDSLIHQSVLKFLKSNISPSKDVLEEIQWNEPLFSEEKAVENWKRLLTVNILCNLTGEYKAELTSKVRVFERHPWNQSSQYFRSLVALNHALVKMPVPDVGTSLLESGAALIDLHEYCPWLALPYTPQHFEFAIFLSLLSFHENREDLKEIVLRLALWQLNTLDAQIKPLSGLFVRENERNVLQHLCLNHLLFRCASHFGTDNIFSIIAKKSLKDVLDYVKQEKEQIDPLWALIENCLDRYGIQSCSFSYEETKQNLQIEISKDKSSLPEQIYDPSTALAGYRSIAQHVVCTLHGERTGLGDIRFGDIQIVTYGPQYLPLSDCRGFGIEGNALSDRGERRSVIESRRSSFVLKGCTRMIDKPSSTLLEVPQFRGIWLEVVQEFKKPHFYLNTNFLGMDGWDSVAFSFFIKASSCRVQTRSLFPRTLNRFVGHSETIFLQGKHNALELRSLSFKGMTHIIPLAGENHFWGADFLISYILSPSQRQYQWHLTPS